MCKTRRSLSGGCPRTFVTRGAPPRGRSAATQTQRLGGLAHVAFVAGEGFLDQEAFDVLQAHVLDPRALIAVDPQAQIAKTDGRALRHEDAPLDGVIELADVARPWMIEERLECRGFETGQRLAVTLGMLPEKIRGERRDVFAPLPQRRQANFDGVDPEQQVLPETSSGHFVAENRVRRRHDADVDVAGARGADALEVARFEDAQQLRLKIDRHVRDLVEEECASVGHLESADAVGLGIGEGAFDMTEELALEDAF